MNAAEWKSKGQLITVNGFKHFVIDINNDKPCLLILHGYPTCSYDYHKVLSVLATEYRVVIHDHLGFGYSDKPQKYSYSLLEQTDQALMLWQQLGIEKATVLAHDYGTSIATEIMARQLRFINSSLCIEQVILCNGSMHIELAELRMIQKLLMNDWFGPWVAKLSTRRTLSKNLKGIYHDSTLLDETEIDALWHMMKYNDGRMVLPKITQYIKQRYTYWHRWIGALRSTDLPVHIVWAENDPVAVVEMSHTLKSEITDAQLTLLESAGHFPMLETPERWSRAVLDSVHNSP